MKALRKLLDNIKPHVEKGGKFHFLHSGFDSVETLFFVPNTVTKTGAHIRDSIDLKRTMFIVVIALIPALLYGMWNIGYNHFLSIGTAAEGTFMDFFLFGFVQMLPIIIVSYGVGLGLEIMFAQARGHEVNEGFFVSGMLIPLIIPIDTPLWMVAIAVAFAVIIGKEVFGGTGMNIWNPALIARAFLFFAYPSSMSGDKIWVEGLNELSVVADGFSGATPLAVMAAEAGDTVVNFAQGIGNWSIAELIIGSYPGSIGETSVIAIGIGALILLATGVGSWKVMFSTFAGGLAMAYLFNILAPEEHIFMNMPAYFHLIIGGFAFGAVFMATDPVSATQTSKGKYIYGFLIGVIAVIIRVFNPAYPEGMMLSILLLNTFAPLIDYYVVQGNIKKRLKRIKVNA